MTLSKKEARKALSQLLGQQFNTSIQYATGEQFYKSLAILKSEWEEKDPNFDYSKFKSYFAPEIVIANKYATQVNSGKQEEAAGKTTQEEVQINQERNEKLLKAIKKNGAASVTAEPKKASTTRKVKPAAKPKELTEVDKLNAKLNSFDLKTFKKFYDQTTEKGYVFIHKSSNQPVVFGKLDFKATHKDVVVGAVGFDKPDGKRSWTYFHCLARYFKIVEGEKPKEAALKPKDKAPAKKPVAKNKAANKQTAKA